MAYKQWHEGDVWSAVLPLPAGRPVAFKPVVVSDADGACLAWCVGYGALCSRLACVKGSALLDRFNNLSTPSPLEPKNNLPFLKTISNTSNNLTPPLAKKRVDEIAGGAGQNLTVAVTGGTEGAAGAHVELSPATSGALHKKGRGAALSLPLCLLPLSFVLPCGDPSCLVLCLSDASHHAPFFPPPKHNNATPYCNRGAPPLPDRAPAGVGARRN